MYFYYYCNYYYNYYCSYLFYNYYLRTLVSTNLRFLNFASFLSCIVLGFFQVHYKGGVKLLWTTTIPLKNQLCYGNGHTSKGSENNDVISVYDFRYEHLNRNNNNNNITLNKFSRISNVVQQIVLHHTNTIMHHIVHNRKQKNIL